MENSLRDLRRNLELGQKAVADAICVTVQVVSRWECGDCEPGAMAILKLSKFFKTSTVKIRAAVAEARRRKARAMLNEIGEEAVAK